MAAGTDPSLSLQAEPPAGSGAIREVAGTVERILFSRERDGFAILRLLPAEGGDPLLLVGELAGLAVGEAIRVAGVMEVDAAYGPRLRVLRVEPLLPTSAAAVANWLGSGVIAGLGPRLARRLLDHFGEHLPEALHDPERLAQVRGIGRKLAVRTAETWRTRLRTRDLLIALQAAGIGPARVRRLFERLGEGAAAQIASDPYRLAREIPGISFHTADRLAQTFGIEAAAPVRIRAGLEHVLRQAAEEGHSALRVRPAIRALQQLLALERSQLEAALPQAMASGTIVTRRIDGEDWLLLAELDWAEAEIAADLNRLLTPPRPWQLHPGPDLAAQIEEGLGLTLSPSQGRALTALLQHKVAILTGGPGTGKTTLVRALLALLADFGLAIALAAPTGRAARRLTEATGYPAQTLHRLLEADPAHGFRRGRARPLAIDLLVVDESSMLDLPLARAMFAALPDRAGLWLVGDADQLPSVGPGQVLADLCASGCLPVLTLEEIFRQAAGSGIVAAAHRIRRGLFPNFEPEAANDCFGVRIESVADAQSKLVELVVRRIPQRFGLDPKREIQVLVPTHRGPLGTRALNRLLQHVLDRPEAPYLEHGGFRFTLGSRVMQTENDSQREVYNGDIGIIVDLEPHAEALIVDMDGRAVRYEGAELDRLAPAYAVTVHKAQGSEYPAVVLVLAREHGRMLRRRLLYTAVTRAKRLLVVLAEPAALTQAIKTPEPPRASLLLPRLRGLPGVPA